MNINTNKNLGQNLQLFIQAILGGLNQYGERKALEQAFNQSRLGVDAGSPVQMTRDASGQPAPVNFNPRPDISGIPINNAALLQNLLPLMAMGSQKAQAAFQTQMAMQPQPFTMSPGQQQFERNPVSGQTRPTGVSVPPNPPKLGIERVVGEDGYYYDALEDPRTGKTIYRKTDLKARPQGTGGSENSFDDFRGTPAYNDAIKAIANGSSKLSTSIVGRYSTPVMKMKVLSDVKKVNPDYKEYTFENDRTFKQQYLPSGRVGQKIANLNTAISHTGELLGTVDKLGNDSAQIVNSVKNWIAQTFGTERATPLNTFEAVKNALAGELGALFKGGNAAATDIEIDNISKVISSAQNPQALKSALVEFLKVGKQRIDQFAVPYNDRFLEDNDFLNPEPRKILERLGVIQGKAQKIKVW